MGTGIETYAGNDKVRDVILTKLAGDDLVELFAVLSEVTAARGGEADLDVAAAEVRLDGAVLPLGYILTATPYMWLAILLAWP